MSDREYEKRIEKLTKESVRLQKWQIVVSTLLGMLTLVGTAYLTENIWVLLIIGIMVSLVLVFIATMSTESDESLWMQKVTAANNLRRIYLIYKEDSSNAASSMGNVYRSALETAFGQAVVSGKQSAVDYFKRLIDEYDTSLSRS